MSEIDKLLQAVEMATQSWPPFHDGDSNLVDVYWLAQKIREILGVVLPTELPPKNEGVLAFECVEANLLCDPQNRVLRNISVADVGQRIVNLAGALKGMLPFSGDQNLMVSLYAWHGLHPHGKTASLRPQHSGGPGSLYATDETQRGTHTSEKIGSETRRKATAGCGTEFR